RSTRRCTIERQNAGKIASPGPERQAVNLDLRIACPAERPRHAFRRVGLGDARDVGDEVHRLSIAEPLDLPPGERRGMIRPHDMGLLEALERRPAGAPASTSGPASVKRACGGY